MDPQEILISELSENPCPGPALGADVAIGALLYTPRGVIGSAIDSNTHQDKPPGAYFG